MAYMNQDKKSKIVAAVKPLMKKYGVKGSFAVRNHSTIVFNIKSGPIDFVENYIQTDFEKPYAKHFSEDQVEYIRKNKSIDVNPYWYHEHFTGKAKEFLTQVFAAMKSADWYDRTDAQIDYFDTAYYVDVNIGKWDKPYEVTP